METAQLLRDILAFSESDIKIRCRHGKIVPANRYLLKCRSPVFNAILSSNNSKKIKLTNYGKEAIEALVAYLERAVLPKIEDPVVIRELLQLSEQFLVKSLQTVIKAKPISVEKKALLDTSLDEQLVYEALAGKVKIDVTQINHETKIDVFDDFIVKYTARLLNVNDLEINSEDKSTHFDAFMSGCKAIDPQACKEEYD